MDVTVCIRTHNPRLYLANRLKATCRRSFPEDTPLFICNNGEPSVRFSEIFIANLASIVTHIESQYILIIEDDIDLTSESYSAVSKALSRGDTHNWYTVDTLSDILEKSICVPGYGYILSSAKSIYYSGSVLLKVSDLKDFLEMYILNHTEFEFSNFDLKVSSFLLDRYGYLHLRPGYFSQIEGVVSSIISPGASRVVRDPSETFTYKGPKV